jgi:hypothetical protein
MRVKIKFPSLYHVYKKALNYLQTPYGVCIHTPAPLFHVCGMDAQ